MPFREEVDHVPGQVLRAFLLAIERVGQEPLRVLRFADLYPSVLLNPSAQLSWDELAALVEGFAQEHGQETLNKVAREMTESLPGLRLVSGFMLPPRAFYRVLADVARRARFWSVQYEDGGTRAVLDVQLKKARRGSKATFEALGGALSHSLSLLNLPEAAVEQTAHSHGGRYVLGLPRPSPNHPRVADQQVGALIEQLIGNAPWAPPEGGGALPSIAQLQKRFALTRAEARVVRLLVEGHSLGEISAALGVGAETVRTHAKRAMQKTDTHRQAELVALVLRVGPAPTVAEE